MKTLITSDDKDAVIAALLERVEVLAAQNAALMALNASLVARVAELEAKLGLPPKTPDNSSLPPSTGHKPSLPSISKRKAKPSLWLSIRSLSLAQTLPHKAALAG